MLVCAFEYFIIYKLETHYALIFKQQLKSHASLNLLRDKETDRDKKIFTCYFQMILVVFQISMAGGVEGIWEVVERKYERHLEGCLRSFQSCENGSRFSP